MPQSRAKSQSWPQNEAAPNSMLIETVPAAPISIARLPPMRSVKRPLMICPQP